MEGTGKTGTARAWGMAQWVNPVPGMWKALSTAELYQQIFKELIFLVTQQWAQPTPMLCANSGS